MAGALDGRKVLITGASSGIGAATAEAMVAEGAAVALGARRRDRLDELASRIDGDGAKAVGIEADIADEAQAKSLVESAHAELGGLDTLVNNAGVMLLGPVIGADTEEWRRMVDVNLLGLLYCTHAALPIMGAQGSGHIVNISSVAGRFANLGSAVYNLTKFGVNAFSEALRQEVVRANVKVTVIEPGMVETELLSHNKHPMVLQAAEKMRADVGEPLTSEDIAEAILYAVGGPERVAVNEVLVRPAGQQR
jgi:NADP-dependent 3-hydroxy acid dehydrogenase YdfG